MISLTTNYSTVWIWSEHLQNNNNYEKQILLEQIQI